MVRRMWTVLGNERRVRSRVNPLCGSGRVEIFCTRRDAFASLAATKSLTYSAEPKAAPKVLKFPERGGEMVFSRFRKRPSDEPCSAIMSSSSSLRVDGRTIVPSSRYQMCKAASEKASLIRLVSGARAIEKRRGPLLNSLRACYRRRTKKQS